LKGERRELRGRSSLRYPDTRFIPGFHDPGVLIAYAVGLHCAAFAVCPYKAGPIKPIHKGYVILDIGLIPRGDYLIVYESNRLPVTKAEPLGYAGREVFHGDGSDFVPYPIFVHVICLERNQGVVEFVQGFRNSQAQSFKPVGPDHA